MARPSQSREKRQELLPIVARTFAELGYRRTTTAELADRCGVRENILYRLWPDKRAMFVAAIDYVYELSARIWQNMSEPTDDQRSSAERLLEYEAKHHGEFGMFRIVFAGLSETDDPEIRAALRHMYDRFHRFINAQIQAHRDDRSKRSLPNTELAAWAIVGLGTVANIGRELGLVKTKERRRLFSKMGRLLLEGKAE